MPSAPALNAWRNFATKSTATTETSNIQMMKGNSTNISTPLMRCRIETMPAAGKRYVGRSVRALMLRNSGLFLASSVMAGFFFRKEARYGEERRPPKILLQRNTLTRRFQFSRPRRCPRGVTLASAQVVAIVVGVGAIEAAAQLHRDVVVGVGEAFHREQR